MVIDLVGNANLVVCPSETWAEQAGACSIMSIEAGPSYAGGHEQTVHIGETATQRLSRLLMSLYGLSSFVQIP